MGEALEEELVIGVFDDVVRYACQLLEKKLKLVRNFVVARNHFKLLLIPILSPVQIKRFGGSAR